MEHVYWLGDAIKDNNTERAQAEINEIVRFSKDVPNICRKVRAVRRLNTHLP